MQHLDEGTIHAWLDGALPASESAAVEQHARECAECAALVADARGMIAGAARIVSALDDVPAGVLPKRPPAAAPGSLWRTLRLTPLRAALAASLMVAAASLLVIRSAPRDEAKMDAVATTAVPPASAPAPAPSAAAPFAAAPAKASAELERVRSKEVAAQSTARDRTEGAKARTVAAAAAPAAPTVVTTTASVADSVSGAAKIAAAEPARVAEAKAAESREAMRELPRTRVDAARQSLDSTRARNAAATDAGASAAAGGIARGVAMQRAMSDLPRPTSLILTSADDRPLTTPGCYRIVADSVTPRFRLPERLSLESSTEFGASRNIVRALTEDGRRDSVFTGLVWKPAPGATGMILISEEAPPVLALSRRASPAITAGFGNPIRLARMDCR